MRHYVTRHKKKVVVTGIFLFFIIVTDLTQLNTVIIDYVTFSSSNAFLFI